MVEPLFYRTFGSQPTAGQEIELAGTEARHAISVRRMRVGEAIQLSDGLGLRARGKVSAIFGQTMQIALTEVAQELAPAVELILIQALAKGDRDEMAVQAGTELGITEVVPWQADRSISRWDGAKVAKGVERWQTIAQEAAKQALRVFQPRVKNPVSSKELARSVAGFDLVLVLDPTSPRGLMSITLPAEGRVAIVVGPEGGITDAELELLEKAGAARVHLGTSILRTSTAGLAAISALQAKLGQWG